MNSELQRFDETRDALLEALGARDWEAIGRLDEACRGCIDDMLKASMLDEAIVRERLEGLLQLYGELVSVTTGERQAIADEMTQINQAKNASKVYHLFS
ncbi:MULTISPECIES: flagellar protein FliT [unclassified Pseudomonas]|uniref:flagellar protein FliT n=1 Tax=unclassified Pseudomonas TaxID=196821 RepID=UPI002446FB90|nr:MULTISPECIES: flagellar protein FliT [unclassified Pseudomonas]MDH0300311.1 flagellar protein FliT [Pseudomonas sp. GD04091]MDH1986053.1 flagellar protein FliT [Pseudomonas sp. GD03689]